MAEMTFLLDANLGLSVEEKPWPGFLSAAGIRASQTTDLVHLDEMALGYINKSCSSSYFSPAVLLAEQGRRLDEFFEIQPTAPWQGQIDAVVSNQVRATMLPEDVWKTTAENARLTKVIGRYDNATPPVVVARHDLDAAIREALLDALVAWTPKWAAVYGAFRPYYYADVHCFFHDLDQLPAGV